MGIFTTVIFVILLSAAIIYQVLKRQALNSLTNTIQQKAYKATIINADKPLTNKLLGEYTCDLFRIRALLLKNDKGFKGEIDKALEKNYTIDNRKDFLELYFHQFLIKGDKVYAEKFLHKIEELGDMKFLKYNKQAYEVIVEKRTDLLDEMIEEIETDKYSGFALGIVVYIIGVQYLYLEDNEKAREYFYNSLTCFHPQSIYTPIINKLIKQLTKEMDVPELTY